MPFSVSCPSCKASLFVQDNLAGKKIKCPKCSQVVPVVAPAKPAAALAGARAPAPAAPKPPAPAARPSTPAAPKPAAPAGTVTITCAGCTKKLQVRADLAGKAVKCPGCGKAVRVPGGAPAPAKPAAAAAPARTAPAAPAPAAPPAAGDDEWTEINEAAEAPPPSAARAGPSGDWGETLMADHGVPDDMKEKIRSELSKNEKIIWFNRPRVDILVDQAKTFRLIMCLVGFGIGGLIGTVGVFLFKVSALGGCIAVGMGVLLSLIGVWGLGAPARQKRKAPTRACYAITNRRVLIHPGTGTQAFYSGGQATVIVNTGSLGVISYNGLELSRMQRVDNAKFPGAGSLSFSRTLLEVPSGAGMWALDDVARVEKLIREKLLHPVIDKVMRGEKLTKEEKGKTGAGEEADKGSGGESEDAGAPDANIKDFGSRGALVPDDDPNIKAAPGVGRSSGGKGGNDPNTKELQLGIEYNPDELREDVRQALDKELTEGETVKWVGWPEAAVQGRGMLGAMVGSAQRKEPDYYLYAITNRRVILWAKTAGGPFGIGKGNARGPTTYYPPHILRAGLEDDKRIPQGGSIVFKQVKVKITTTDKQGRSSTRTEMHYFGLMRLRRYKAVAVLLYETLIKPWVES